MAQAARWIAEQFKHRGFCASIAIVDDATMRQLNAGALGHDWSTDVISFVLDELDDSVEGEVIASGAETAAQVCSAAGWSSEMNYSCTSCMACCTWPVWTISNPKIDKPCGSWNESA
ncbi:MAG: rRNA maturation RNAse YbeY [Pirellulaceae bacterium]